MRKCSYDGDPTKNFPTAQGMRRRTEEANNVIAKIKLGKLLDRMKATRNQFVTISKKDFPVSYRGFLERLGYEITTEETESDKLYTISWEQNVQDYPYDERLF